MKNPLDYPFSLGLIITSVSILGVIALGAYAPDALSYLKELIKNLNTHVDIFTPCITIGAIFASFNAVHNNSCVSLINGKAASLLNIQSIKDIIKSISRSAQSAILFTLASFFCHLLTKTHSGNISLYAICCWAGIFVWMILSFLRIHHIFQIMILIEATKREK